MIALPRLRRLHRFAARLRSDERAVALTEMAFATPILLIIGMYGVEVSNLALTNLRISQYALNLADNASRVGKDTLVTQQLRESDINDVLQGTRLQGSGLKLTTYGRVTLSSLENIKQSYDTATPTAASSPVQRIHWQRCIGLKSGTGWDSTYGTTTTTAGTDSLQSNAGTATPAGMGDTGAKVNAPVNAGVMFVEINYQYQPLFSKLMAAPKIHYIASFIVRDNRDFSQVFPPATPRSTCDLHAV